jgi:tRNA threonylcarbamoyladenosine biosynthesis protein TsaB
MLLLVTDTSGRQGSVALAHVESPGEVRVIEAVLLVGGSFSAQLVPQIAALLDKHGFGKNDIEAFIVVSGPGSFTGLRVGLAAIKALAEISGRPIVAVSLLEVIALASRKTGKVLAALDAGRGEFYVGEYQRAGGTAQLVREQLLSKDELFSMAREAVAVSPDERLSSEASSAAIPFERVTLPDAASIASLGWQKLQANETVSAECLEANYIRRTDAEILAKR